VLQTLNPGHLLGGRMKIRQDLAERAIGRLAERLALGIPANRARHPSVVDRQHGARDPRHSVQRGHDPRDYTLMAFGGAGTLAGGAAGQGTGDRSACWCRPIPASCAPWACC
jgi:N-methylhydantoinase A